MAKQIICYDWHPPGINQYLFGFIAIACGAGSILASIHESSRTLLIIGILFLFCAFFCFVKQETRIDTELRLVIREGRLFGRFRVWFTRYPFDAFAGVTCRRFERVRDNDTVYVGLRRKKGRIMELRYFNVASGYPDEQAKREAQNVAENIGLPLDG